MDNLINTSFGREITERFDEHTLAGKLIALNAIVEDMYDKHFTHKASQGRYIYRGVGITNINGTAYYCVYYSPYSASQVIHILHNRPVHEFFDGRFISDKVVIDQ